MLAKCWNSQGKAFKCTFGNYGIALNVLLATLALPTWSNETLLLIQGMTGSHQFIAEIALPKTVAVVVASAAPNLLIGSKSGLSVGAEFTSAHPHSFRRLHPDATFALHTPRPHAGQHQDQYVCNKSISAFGAWISRFLLENTLGGISNTGMTGEYIATNNLWG